MSDVGRLRRSGLVATFGPGAIVDFRTGGVAVSGVVAGLEEWDRNFPPPGVAHAQSTVEPRLMQKLAQKGFVVDGFRLPPVLPERDLNNVRDRLIAAEFPHWHHCPQCFRLGHSDRWGRRPGAAARYCQHCTVGRDVHVIPVRFVMACENGHLNEFPWHQWVGHRDGCTGRDDFLEFRSVGAGLRGLRLKCPICKASRNMEGIFTAATWERFRQKCNGGRPWLAGGDQNDCPKVPRAMQRGATNLYFPVTESSLDIPPWDDQLQQQIGQYWSPIMSVKDPHQRAAFVQTLASNVLLPILQANEWTVELLVQEIERRALLLGTTEGEDLRAAEYRQFGFGDDTPREPGRQFEIRVEQVPPELKRWVGRLVRATRLREVRALTGFTRITPPGDAADPRHARLSLGRPRWLPAIEVFGEGIFVDLNRETLAEWEARPQVISRAAEVAEKWSAEYRSRFGTDPDWRPSARFLLIHTFAHALMRQLTMDCGYSTSSLRERLYVDTGEHPMGGLLIYTSTADSDGTLGGLQRQGLPANMVRILPAAVQAMEWCSSDPLCGTGMMAPAEAASGAACHACVLAPETACEHFNRLLDRGMLVGNGSEPDLGYFRRLLQAT